VGSLIFAFFADFTVKFGSFPWVFRACSKRGYDRLVSAAKFASGPYFTVTFGGFLGKIGACHPSRPKATSSKSATPFIASLSSLSGFPMPPNQDNFPYHKETLVMPIPRISIAFALLASLSGVALAAGGGGGGGGGSMPSQSAPQYDAAEEYRKGIAALDAKDFKAAKTAFDRVITMAPKDANTQYLGGMARVGLNDWKGAKRFFEKSVKLNPNFVPARAQMGLAYAMTKDKPKAEAVLAELTTMAAKCAGECSDAKALKAGTDAISAALAAAPQARASDSQPMLFASAAVGDGAYLEAVGLINEGRYDAALTSLRTAQQSFGPHPDILTYIGFANRKMKRFDVAETYYRQALAVAPNHRGAKEYFGELMVERGDLEGAKAMLASLDRTCQFGCAEAEELRRWIAAGKSPHS
jgi:tetratricopeptide (TPR) repeat protein